MLPSPDGECPSDHWRLQRLTLIPKAPLLMDMELVLLAMIVPLLQFMIWGTARQ